MKSIRDPESAELNHLIHACPLNGKNILEIGCGEGQFTQQYEGLPDRIVGIDPDITDLLAARHDHHTIHPRVDSIQAIGENLPFRSQAFDIVIFASSL